MQVDIYSLIDPTTNAIRYVGLTRHLRHRFSQHIFGSKSNKHLNNWIGKLKSQGLLPIMKVLESVPESEADKVEREYIRKFKEDGCNLVNLTDGGEGNFSPSEEARRAIGENTRRHLTGRKQPMSQRLKRIASLKGRRLNPHPSYFLILNKARIGIPLSEEHKRKVRESLRRRYENKDGGTRSTIAES